MTCDLVIATTGRGITAPVFKMIPHKKEVHEYVTQLGRDVWMRSFQSSLIQGYEGIGYYRVYLWVEKGQYSFKIKRVDIGANTFQSASSLPYSECTAFIFPHNIHKSPAALNSRFFQVHKS